VAYLMADISNVQRTEVKEIFDSLEALSCKFHEALSRRSLSLRSILFSYFDGFPEPWLI
jgi:hypothetical protein